MEAIGVVPIPKDFRYMSVLQKGRPIHDKLGNFSIHHPPMPTSQRAKQFAPFDALAGFSDSIGAKEIQYEAQKELSREEERELNRRLEILHNLTYNSRMARINRPCITVFYFVPCADPQHPAFGVLGKYKTISGVCGQVDPDLTQTLLVNGQRISFDTIWKIESNSLIFRQPEEAAV
ncbi:MAG: hypothetical protein IKO68_05525 [Oscillospiraceae bacterium]|nr:hypothetical protein [Oscillospiraceae bacterium]